MNSDQQTCINTIAFWVGQMVLAKDNEYQFVRHLDGLQQDLDKIRRRLVPRTIIDTEVNDDEL